LSKADEQKRQKNVLGHFNKFPLFKSWRKSHLTRIFKESTKFIEKFVHPRNLGANLTAIQKLCQS
jgi:hypothetical protein